MCFSRSKYSLFHTISLLPPFPLLNSSLSSFRSDSIRSIRKHLSTKNSVAYKTHSRPSSYRLASIACRSSSEQSTFVIGGYTFFIIPLTMNFLLSLTEVLSLSVVCSVKTSINVSLAVFVSRSEETNDNVSFRSGCVSKYCLVWPKVPKSTTKVVYSSRHGGGESE